MSLTILRHCIIHGPSSPLQPFEFQLRRFPLREQVQLNNKMVIIVISESFNSRPVNAHN